MKTLSWLQLFFIMFLKQFSFLNLTFALLIASTFSHTVPTLLPTLPPILPQTPAQMYPNIAPPYQIYPIHNTSSPFCLLGSKPVCGADNRTYPNPCVLALLQIAKKSDGWCPEIITTTTITTISYKIPNNGYLTANQNTDPTSPCPCNSVYNPICGKNGVTYASRCRLECANIALSHEGPCGYFNWAESPHFNCPCPFEFSPVCGRDNTTYENECALRCAHQSLLSQGACLNPCNCSNTYKPLCGRNGKTYKNICLLKCDKQEVFKSGKCPDRRPKRCSYCEGLVSPVCATNGITYDNQCYLKCSGSAFYARGKCPDDSAYGNSDKKEWVPACESCRPVVLPVCASNGRTFRNACSARCKGLKIHYRGKCLHENKVDYKQNNCNCTNVIQPVCGTDGRTYQNKCFANCYSIKVLYPSACQVQNPGYCHHICRSFRGPIVCGKNHITYLNECVMTTCMKIPKLKNGTCDSLNSSNHPGNFFYDRAIIKPKVINNARPVHSTPVQTRHVQQVTPVQHGPAVQQHWQRPVTTVSVKAPSPVVYPQSGSSVDIQNIDLTNKNSVIKVYKLLFPNGRALDQNVLKYKSILEGLLLNRFKIDPRRLF